MESRNVDHQRQQSNSIDVNEPIEQQLMNDILLDDGEMNEHSEYKDIEIDEHVTGIFKFIQNWWQGKGVRNWQQHYFFLIQFVYFVVLGVFFGFLVFIFERNNTRIGLLDSLYTSFSAICVSGFLVQPIDTVHVRTQFVFFLATVCGGITLTSLPPLLVKIYRARKRMIAKRQERLMQFKQSMEMNANALLNDGSNQEITEVTEHVIEGIASVDVINEYDSQLTLNVPHPDSELHNSASNESLDLASVDSVSSLDGLVAQQPPSRTLSPQAVRNFQNATHMDEKSFFKLPSAVQSYFDDIEFDAKKFNPLHWPETVQSYFTNNASYDYYNSIPITDIEYTALVWLFILTVVTEVVILFTGFILLGLEFSQITDQLDGKNPWFLSLFLTFSSFNNSGFMLFSDNLIRFERNITVTLVVAFLIILGNTAFPIILRFIIFVCYKFSRQYKLVFKYLLEKHHHLSTHLFPGLQTRAYALISFALFGLGVITPLILDNERSFRAKPFGYQLLIAFFHAVSCRTGGFATTDITTFSMATLCVYIMMMRIKSQMACGLRENAYKIIDVVRKLNLDEKHAEQVLGEINSSSHNSLFRETKLTIVVKESEAEQIQHIEESLIIRAKHFLKLLWKHMWYHTKNLLAKNNAWLVFMVIAITFSESGAGIHNPDINVFRIVFEVVSAFGNVGLSLSMPGSVLAFSAALNGFSKFCIILVMITGRHRGWYGSMVDQQEDQYDINLTSKSLMKQRFRVEKKNL
jgi:Trk-type K+ transport system membrane component